MDGDQVLAFRLARSGLAVRAAGSLPEAVACPASDFSSGAALLAVAARVRDVSRARYDDAVDRGEVVVAHVARGAIHALAPRDFALYGRALIAADEDELAAQLGRQVQRLTTASGIPATAALAEVTDATRDALAGGRALDRTELHEELRSRVPEELLPWCQGCRSHHVAPMLWRYATVRAGIRLTSARRYVQGEPGPAPAAGEALRRFLGFYGPATVADFAEWAGIVRAHAQRLFDGLADELTPVGAGSRRCWLMRADADALASPPEAQGVRLLPPGDPYLQKPNRALLAPDADLRKRLWRPVASPGAVLRDGRLAGLWRVRTKGRRAELTVEAVAALKRTELDDEAPRVAALRGAGDAKLVLA